jgi:AraC-like DNA-binding protein
MARGLDMLSRDTTVTEIALTLGYDSISSFSATFQRTFHVSPSDYRARRRIAATSG